MAQDTSKTLVRDVYTISANHFARYGMNEVAVSADHNHDHLKVVVSGHKTQLQMVNDFFDEMKSHSDRLLFLEAA